MHVSIDDIVRTISSMVWVTKGEAMTFIDDLLKAKKLVDSLTHFDFCILFHASMSIILKFLLPT